MRPLFAPVVIFLLCLAGMMSAAQAPSSGTAEKVAILAPVAHQVIQRQPDSVGKADAKGQRTGFAATRLVLDQAGSFEWRVVALTAAFGKGTDWTGVSVTTMAGATSALITIPAGGWYRLELRRSGNATLAGKVEPIGVGEVFLVAGQSYAENCNDEQLKVEEPQGRVTALDLKTGTWAVANDPQPNLSSNYANGSIWPACGDALAKTTRVPVGFVNVARAATASVSWLPGQELYRNLVRAGKSLGSFRAVLWQQGESDVIARTTTETYVSNLVAIRTGVAKEWAFEPAWLLAKSTIHPTVYKNPQQEAVIRAAIDRLWNTPGFRPGPDTDTLTGENRGGAGSKQHFTGLGQRRAGNLWAKAIAELIGVPTSPAR